MHPETDSLTYLNGNYEKPEYIPNGNTSKNISKGNKQSCQYDVDNKVEEKLLTGTENGGDVHMERSLGLIGGTAIIVGTMIGELANYTDSIMKFYRIIARILVNIVLSRILYCAQVASENNRAITLFLYNRTLMIMRASCTFSMTSCFEVI